MAKVKAMGFKEVEMAGTFGLSFPQFIKLLAINELSVVSYGIDFEKLENFPDAAVDEARAYGARYISCSWIPHEGEVFTKEDADRAIRVLNQAGKTISRNGLLLCYHPHGYEFGKYENGTLFDYMMSQLDSRYVYLEMDVFWIKQAGQDPIAILKKYPSRFVLMHLKDRKHGTKNTSNGHADTESNVVLGSGDVGIAEVIRVSRELGIKHYFIEDESSKPLTQIPESLSFLKTLSDQTRK
jgi:sugar phosphate isomerase/epimerase